MAPPPRPGQRRSRPCRPRRRVLPLDGICSGCTRELDGMMADAETVAEVAAEQWQPLRAEDSAATLEGAASLDVERALPRPHASSNGFGVDS